MAINYSALPSFYTDPLFQKSQKDLYSFGSGLLNGTPNEYYKPIGEAGGAAFEDVVRMTNRDVQKSALEAAAKTGTRGGAVSSAVAKATADSTTSLRWQDVLRSIQGKEFLLSAGLDTVGGVRNAGLSYGNSMNDFNLQSTQIADSRETANAQMSAQDKARKSQMWSSILSAGIGAASNFYGVGMLSKALSSGGAASAGTLAGTSTDLSKLGIDYGAGINAGGWLK